ncbi:MAG: ATP-binding cassette domain-containing protein [Actinomycetota bacterium]
MSAIHFHDVSFSYTSAVPIVEDASFNLGPGWTGLVGANGAGKSTILHLVAGDHPPAAGEIRLVPPRTTPVLCEQRVDERTGAIDAFATDWDRDAIRLRDRLRLDPSDLERWTTLSPGERKRWQIGAALAASPHILLLDEPTNHLDEDARSLLLSVLEAFDGAGVIVSHDRDVLERLTSRTLRIQNARLSLRNAPYEQARAGWDAEAGLAQQELDRLKREKKATKRRLADQRRTAEEKDAKRLRERQQAGIHDLDTRGAVATGRHASGQRAGAREREVTRSRLEDITERINETAIDRKHGGAISFPADPSKKEFLIRHSGPVAIPSGETLFEADVAVRRTDRIRLAGPNGAGKTTLLKSLVASAAIPADRMLVLQQETTRAEAPAWLDRVRSLPPTDRGRVLSLVSLLGTDPAPLLSSGLPSPGEARKLALALGLGTPTWLLALDEPTNHLDLPSIERLETALRGYPGAILLITHDTRLAATVTTVEWRIDRSGHLTIASA